MHHRITWSDVWLAAKPLKHVPVKSRLGYKGLSLDVSPPWPPAAAGGDDLTAQLSDELLLRILAFVPDPLRLPASLVCKRWLRLVGRLRRAITLLDWSFLDLRLHLRFPDLTDVDLVPASFASPSTAAAGVGALLSRGSFSVAVDIRADPPVGECRFLEPDVIDRGLKTVVRDCPGLRKLSLVAVVSEMALMDVAEGCGTLQELDLHGCSDHALRPISAFSNLQILRLVGFMEGLYSGPGVTDVGLTILAHGCKRLVKLELCGCAGSYEGICAIGRCCVMLEELTISGHRMDDGWITGLCLCGNLKTLRLVGCRKIDADPGPLEHLGTCPTIETLQIQRCQLRDKRSLQALLIVCEVARDLLFENCWGFDNDLFGLARNCKRVKFLSLEGCSFITTDGLQSVVLSWVDLQRLVVDSCNKIKDSEVSPALSSLFSDLKEFKWRPDFKSVLAMSFEGTGMRKKGARLFKKRIMLRNQQWPKSPRKNTEELSMELSAD